MIASQTPKYEYTPDDFMNLSLITAILCGIFSPLTLIMTIPAILLSAKVNNSGCIVPLYIINNLEAGTLLSYGVEKTGHTYLQSQ